MFMPERLKECREQIGMSQEDMILELDKSGLRISRQTLMNWEKGEYAPDVNAIQIIANLLRKPIQYFFNQQHCTSGQDNSHVS